MVNDKKGKYQAGSCVVFTLRPEQCPLGIPVPTESPVGPSEAADIQPRECGCHDPRTAAGWCEEAPGCLILFPSKQPGDLF